MYEFKAKYMYIYIGTVYSRDDGFITVGSLYRHKKKLTYR